MMRMMLEVSLVSPGDSIKVLLDFVKELEEQFLKSADESMARTKMEELAGVLGPYCWSGMVWQKMAEGDAHPWLILVMNDALQ